MQMNQLIALYNAGLRQYDTLAAEYAALHRSYNSEDVHADLKKMYEPKLLKIRIKLTKMRIKLEAMEREN